MVTKKKTDWEAVERDYRTGKYTLRELETKHGASNSLISRKARNEEWVQDLAIVIQQATEAKLIEKLTEEQVVAQEVRKEVRKGAQSAQKVRNTVDAMAVVARDVILEHRTGLKEIAAVKKMLVDQIRQAAVHIVDLEEVIEMVRRPDDNGMDKANDALRKAMSRSALADDLKKLSDVDEKVRKGEREAFKLDDAPAPTNARSEDDLTVEGFGALIDKALEKARSPRLA
jgi:hypothetical protein